MRIYRIARAAGITSQVGTASLEDHLSQAAQLGFDHVLLAAPLCNFHMQAENSGALRELCAQAASYQLRVLLDLRVEQSLDMQMAGLPEALRDVLRVNPNSSLPNWGDPNQVYYLLPWWTARLCALAGNGVSGFRCMLPASVPPDSWTALLAAVRQAQPRTQFLAWTPGLTPRQTQALAPCGFDAAFTSLPWWDFRGRWLIEEQQRLRSWCAKVIYPVAVEIVGPQAEASTLQIASPPNDAGLANRLITRLIDTACACGDGWLLPAEWLSELANPARTSAPDTRLAEHITDANARLAAVASIPMQTGAAESPESSNPPISLQILSTPGAALTVLSKTLATHTPGVPSEVSVIAINPDPMHSAQLPIDQLLAGLASPHGTRALVPDCTRNAASTAIQAAASPEPAADVALGPADLLQLEAAQVLHLRPVTAQPPRRKTMPHKPVALKSPEHALQMPRIAIERVEPQSDQGRFAVRRVAGERVVVEADVWIDGHDAIAVALRWRIVGARAWHETPMKHIGNDRWQGAFPLEQLGRHEYTVQAWRDPFVTWFDEINKKRAAGQDLTLEIEEGCLLLREIATYAAQKTAATPASDTDVIWLNTLNEQIAGLPELDASASHIDPAVDTMRLRILLDPLTRRAVEQIDYRTFTAQCKTIFPVEADRTAARFGSWYELFPRSQTDHISRHGGFQDVIERLPAIHAMGFDVLYFPPIHPIGIKHRKGRNNSLTADSDDPGSPYAIGSVDGGHQAIHPQLGTLADFHALRDRATALGMELALDFAIQCAPDHPWLTEHPSWFSYRPDGSVRYAENPPKKYQDIVNVDFYNINDAPALWAALRGIVLYWADQGIRIFRVDNPHTKPLPFWEWLIAEVRQRYPDALFLAEAFTRPKPMARLAKLGFTQSYTYFTWRNSKAELTEYIEQLTQTELREYFRPQFFVNTPDINPIFLHDAGRPGFLIRAALASLLSGLWGMVSGYELCESAPLMVNGEAKEEYLDSEKFQIRPRDIANYAHAPNNIVAEISRLNLLRRSFPALQSHLGTRFYRADNPNILYFARYLEHLDTAPDSPRFGTSAILVAINLDPYQTHEADIELPLWEWRLPDSGSVRVEDLMQGYSFVWQGKQQHVRLDPQQSPFAIWLVQPLSTLTTEISA